MKARKAITIYGLPQANATASLAVELSLPIILLSAPAAVSFAGPAWYLSVVMQTQEAYPNADIEAILDCGSFGGHALAALRQGIKTIIYNGTANAAIDNIATQFDACVLRHRPDSLDSRLAKTEKSLNTALRDWLNSEV